MPAQLIALTEGPSILLDKPIMLFGRNPECDIQIDSRKVSRRHCAIAQVNDYLVVRDLGSTNGIRINGVRTQEGKIRAGDELTIGSHRYQVRWDKPDEASGRSMISEPEAPPQLATLPVPPEDDELLEECDEPVPLPEPGGRPSIRPPVPPAATTSVGEDDDDSRPRFPDVPASILLPENLELAPSSNVHRAQQPPNPT